jgi:diguanylate cyclase (GGDEF)-like protein/PAS domain S-box-containing protein
MTPESPIRDTREPEATVALDENGVLVAIDDAAEALLGDRTALGEPMADLAVEPDRPALAALLGALRPGGPALRTTFGLQRADGQVVHTEIIAVAPAGPPGPPGVTAFLHDVSDRHSAEQALAATQAVIGAMARAQAPEAALESLVASLGASMGWEVGGYWKLSADGATLERTFAWSAGDIDARAVTPERYELAGSLSERSFQAGAAQWATDLAADTALRTAATAGKAGLHGAVAVPTTRLGAATGVIAYLSSSVRPPDPGVLTALSLAGAQVGELLGMLQERGDAVDSLRRLALTDDLTGLPNRRAWEEAVRRELARAVRDRHPVCIAVLDLDGFKRFNDEHGHQAGDRVLADSARAWQSQLRGSDVLARYGGEEFAALIPAWPLEIAVEVVERLRLATAGGLTASAGVASWDGRETGEELFGRADAALYEAKQSGRDRTIAAR